MIKFQLCTKYLPAVMSRQSPSIPLRFCDQTKRSFSLLAYCSAVQRKGGISHYEPQFIKATPIDFSPHFSSYDSTQSPYSVSIFRWSCQCNQLQISKFFFSTFKGYDESEKKDDDGLPFATIEGNENEKKKEKHSIDNSDDDDLPESVHYKPRCQRLDPYHGIAIDPNKHFIRQKRKNRLAPTRDLNFTADMWRDHKSVWRHLGSVSIWSTSAFQRLLFPDMFLIFSIGVSLSIATLYGGQFGIFGPDGILFQYLISFEHSTQGIFEGAFGIVVLLLGYRVNTTYSRYVEARILWGALTNSSRDLGRNVCMYVRPPALLSALSSSTASTAESSDALDTLLETQKSRFLNLIRVYPIALRFLLNRKGNHNFISKRDPNFDDQVYVEFRAELYDVWKNHVRISDDYKDNPDLNRILHAFRQKKHVPLLILNMIGSCVSDLSMLRYNDGSSNLPVINPIYIKEMDRQLQRMTTGPFERIVKTPLPTVVTRYASQIMTLLCYTMPFGGIIMLGPYFNPIGSTVGAYLIMSVDDIGIQLEEPFNILPQRQYTDGIVDSIDLIESSFSPAADHSPLRQ